MERADNVVWLRPPSAPTQAAVRSRPPRGRGVADVILVGGLLTGLAFSAQQLVLALSMG